MCFSATASFTASAILIPMGFLAVLRAKKYNSSYLFLAMIPFIFGIQQAFEGGVWLSITAGKPALAHYLSLGYKFFAYFLWPGYFSLSLFFTETNKIRKKLLMVASILGFLLGAIIYFPILLDWVETGLTVEKYSLCYSMNLPEHQKYVYSLVYVGILLFSILVSSVPKLKIFAGMVLSSFIISAIWFEYGFVSVWCFFAALLSFYLIMIIPKD